VLVADLGIAGVAERVSGDLDCSAAPTVVAMTSSAVLTTVPGVDQISWWGTE